MRVINRNFNANDIENPNTNPVNINVETDTDNPNSIELRFTRSGDGTSCKICQYRFDKDDISKLILFLQDAQSWLVDPVNPDNSGDNTPTPVPPGPSDCDKNPNCVNCVGTNIPTPPLGPYDPDFWPTYR